MINVQDQQEKIHHAESFQLIKVQRDILESAINSHDPQQTLNSLCRAAEGIVPNSVSSIMLYNNERKSLQVRAAPNIPLEAVEQLNGLVPGENAGSCGTAVFKSKPQFIHNTAIDERWENLTDFALQFNIQACWSMPIIDGNGITLGSFAISSFEMRQPTDFQINLLETASSLVTLILSKEKSDNVLKDLANTDPLTKLANRALFEKTVSRTIAHAVASKNKFAIVFIDLDNFKSINDKYGHSVGDEVLCCVAKRIFSRIRQHDLLARIGGDEFILLLNNMDDESSILKVAEDIVSCINKPFTVDGIIYHTSVSVGISSFPKYGSNFQELACSADKAMYQAKKQGKNQCILYRAA